MKNIAVTQKQNKLKNDFFLYMIFKSFLYSFKNRNRDKVAKISHHQLILELKKKLRAPSWPWVNGD